MCYTTDEYADPKDETTYDEKLPYRTDGYRTNCNDIEVRGAALLSSVLLLCICGLVTSERGKVAALGLAPLLIGSLRVAALLFSALLFGLFSLLFC